MSDVAVHGVAGEFEPSLFGTYSRKSGCGCSALRLATFGALLFAYTYARVRGPNWPTPFHSERFATLR